MYSILQSSQAIPLGLQIDTQAGDGLEDQAKGDTSTSRPQLSALIAAVWVYCLERSSSPVVMSSITNPYTQRVKHLTHAEVIYFNPVCVHA